MAGLRRPNLKCSDGFSAEHYTKGIANDYKIYFASRDDLGAYFDCRYSFYSYPALEEGKILHSGQQAHRPGMMR